MAKTPLLDALRAFVPRDALPMHMPGHKLRPLPVAELSGYAGLDVTELGRINELIQTMKIGELNRFLEQQRQKGSDSIRIIEVERHARFVYPISTFILTLIGVSLSSRKVRGGTGLHIGLGVGLCFSYILLMRFFEEFAKSGTLPTGLSMWIPNILYCFIAIYLYKKAPK